MCSVVPISLETALRTACLLEVTARKPGNVHPLASFDDCDWETFATSAEAIAPVLAGAAGRPLGETILRAVEATKERVGRNTNLGMILLIAPLAAVPIGSSLKSGIERVLSSTTIDDCRLVYEAIRTARPGGLGTADREDVSAEPTMNLREAMRLAADRDDVALQYVTGFSTVFELATLFSATRLAELEEQILLAFLGRLAQHPDSLIARKCGLDMARESSRLAAECLSSETSEPRTALTSDRVSQIDAFLRADGNRRNPGTTADLIAAALFVAIQENRIPCFDAASIRAYAVELRRAKAGLSSPKEVHVERGEC